MVPEGSAVICFGFSDHKAVGFVFWLRVVYRTTFTPCLMMYVVLNDVLNTYMVTITRSISALFGHVNLCSSTHGFYNIPRTHTCFRHRVFFVARPREWNSLLHQIRTNTERPVFNRVLQSHIRTWLTTDFTSFVWHFKPCFRGGEGDEASYK